MGDSESLLKAAHELGVRLEFWAGAGTWEALPVRRHQRAVRRIEESLRALRPDCTCEHEADVPVRFPDGSVKRPDLSIWAREPDELDSAVTLVPVAVVEVVSKGYEKKDLEELPDWYLSQGVEDVVVLNPHTDLVLHFHESARDQHVAPVTLQLACGCELTCPAEAR